MQLFSILFSIWEGQLRSAPTSPTAVRCSEIFLGKLRVSGDGADVIEGFRPMIGMGAGDLSVPYFGGRMEMQCTI